MLPKLFILPLDKQSIVIQIITGICQGTGTCYLFVGAQYWVKYGFYLKKDI